MADEVIRIIVRADGTSRVVGDLQKIGRAGDGAERAARRLTKAIAGIGAGVGLTAAVRQAIEMSDRYTTMANRVRIFADSQGAANATVNELLKVADRSRSSLEGVSELYGRLSLSAEAYGYSQERVIGVTELVSKAIGMTTGSSQAATGAIVQFAQAIGGDFKSSAQEMNSILEQAPGLADLVAKGLGVIPAELKKLGKEGKLSADLVIQGLESQRTVLDAYTSRTMPTTAAATQALSDATTVLVGQFFETTNAGRTVNSTISAITSEIQKLAADTGRMEAAGKSTINFLEDTIQRGRVVVRVLQEVGTSILTVGQAASSLGQVLNPAALTNLIASGGSPLAALQEGFGPLREQMKALPQFASEIERLSVAPVFTRSTAGASAAAPFAPLPTPAPAANLAGAVGGASEKELAKLAKASDDAVAAFQALRGEYDPLVAAGNQYAESLKVIDEALRTGRISQDAARTTLTGVTAELEKARNASKIAAREGFEELRAQLDPAVAAGNAYAAAIRGINDALVANPGLQGEAARLVGLATTNYTTALKELDKGKKPLSEAGQIVQAMSGQFTNALDSLVNFANTGQASIGEFASSVVSDLQRVALQMLLVQGLVGLSGSFGGQQGIFGQLATAIGGSSAFPNIPGRAGGGPVSRGRPYMVGEEGPELFVPPVRGAIVPNGAGRGPKPVVSVTNMFDGNQMVDAMKTYEGEEVILHMLQRNRGKLREIMG